MDPDAPRPPARQWWRCRNCARPIGLVVGERLVIEVKRDIRWNYPLVDGAIFTCSHCGAPNTLGARDRIRPERPTTAG
jgi:hypothetical protein